MRTMDPLLEVLILIPVLSVQWGHFNGVRRTKGRDVSSARSCRLSTVVVLNRYMTRLCY